MSDTHGLIHCRRFLMESESYLGQESVRHTLSWCKSNGGDCITQCASGTNYMTDTPVMLTLVGIGASGEWYNKLSGIGDQRSEHSQLFSKLKWLIHFKPPSNTIFMKDWDVGMATLQFMQEQVMVGEANNMLILKKKGAINIRTTKNMFVPKDISSPVDKATRQYVVPASHLVDYEEVIKTHSLAPINIRNETGRAIAMGMDAMKLTGGALCLITFEIKHYYTESAHRDSFSTVLHGIKVLVLVSQLAQAILDMQQMSI
ncbi:hypothetical protein EDD85DRAFT_785526 [Armillaria nabsnona]|nr:hypothetical protein EDD85DRAFT_785526 [Armillaria nabsnona]